MTGPARIAPRLRLTLAEVFLAAVYGAPEEHWILIRHQDYSRLTDTLAKRTSTSPRRHEFVQEVSKTRKISPGSISSMSV